MASARYGPVRSNDLTEDNLKGATIYGHDGALIAEVVSLEGTGPYAQLVLQTTGFLGFGSKMVTMPMRSLKFVRVEAGAVEARTLWTLGDLKKAPYEPKLDESLHKLSDPQPVKPV